MWWYFFSVRSRYLNHFKSRMKLRTKSSIKLKGYSVTVTKNYCWRLRSWYGAKDGKFGGQNVYGAKNFMIYGKKRGSL